MRRLVLAVSAVAILGGAGSALAAPPEVPKVPKNCHEWNDLLGIDNVRSCDDGGSAL